MTSTFISWIGATDLRATTENEEVGNGPIAKAVMVHDYSAVVLISNYPQKKTELFIQWLQPKISGKIFIRYACLSSPTDFEDIFQSASGALNFAKKKFGETTNFTFHLSPGTPAMAAVWIILGKTKYPAQLIESSRDHGVKTVSIPFDLAADFKPNSFPLTDNSLQHLAFGLPTETAEFKDIIHQSKEMQRIVIRARLAASRSIPILIEGESGTGKELFARAIHKTSQRSDKPFVAVNCGAIPRELVEAELFGYEKGAFTGAVGKKIGLFENADQGTLFLDEIGELPKNMQVKLLRGLQEKEIKRIGGTTTQKVNVRIIAATNKNLIQEITTGTFREDLFYRLAVAVLKLPPLRSRTGDLGLLIDKLLEVVNEEASNELKTANKKKISASARNVLLNHSWPGNIRELLNTLTRAVVWTPTELISENDIHDALLPVPVQNEDKGIIYKRPIDKGVDLPRIMADVASHYLEEGLAAAQGNKTKAAEMLSLSSYQTLNNWLKKYRITKEFEN